MASNPAQGGERNLSTAACVALCMLAPLSGLAISGIAPVMPLITEAHASDPAAGTLVRLMMSGMSAAMILGALLSGMLAARVGQLRLLLLALVLYAVAGAGIFLLDNLYLMVASRILQGMANAAAGVLAMALITTRVAPHLRDRWLGYYTVIGTVGVLFLMMAIGAVAAFGWRYVFLLFLLALPVGLLLLLTFPADGREENAARSPTASGVAVRRKIPWGLTFFGVMCGAILTTIPMYLPYHLSAIGHGEPEQVAMLMVAGAAAAGLPGLAFGAIRARFSAIQVFAVAFGITAAGLALLVAAQDLPMIYAGMMINGFGMGAIVPNLFSASAAATEPADRARMLGFVRAGFYAGPLLAQPALELVLKSSTAGHVILTIALACLAGAGLGVAARRLFTPAEPVFHTHA